MTTKRLSIVIVSKGNINQIDGNDVANNLQHGFLMSWHSTGTVCYLLNLLYQKYQNSL
jgi:hypothetical protein